MFLICILLSFIINFFSFLLGIKEKSQEKVSIYECGFNPISNTGLFFNIKFFVIGIIFLMFDLEIIFLFPYSVISYFINYEAMVLVIFFIFFILIGFFYDWIKGGLEWE